MTDVVLDTHACLCALAAPRKLGRSVRALLKKAETGALIAWIPAVVVAEIMMLRELGRTDLGLPELQAAVEHAPALAFLPLDLRQLDEFAALTGIRDPFDRLIAGACRAVNGQLATKDARLRTSGLVRTVWE